MAAPEVSVERAELGKPLFYSAWRQSKTPDWSSENWILDKSRSGGTLLDLAIHDLDIALWLFGSPAEALARESSREEGGPGVVTSLLRYSSGAVAQLETGHLMPQGYPFTNGFRAVFAGGALECRQKAGEESLFFRYRGAEAERIGPDELPAALDGDPYAEEIDQFYRAIRSGHPFPVTGEEACAVLELIERLR